MFFIFIFKNEIITTENLGNILYGYSGNAGGYSFDDLKNGGNIYSISTENGPDGADDVSFIKKGFNLYYDFSKDYYYLHISR
ncbi:MAG: hypothetical protein IJM23_06980 [Lachnospiraceae bacterium]|nr:hypothetical protein [Lachnospiraceae bacterium]